MNKPLLIDSKPVNGGNEAEKERLTLYRKRLSEEESESIRLCNSPVLRETKPQEVGGNNPPLHYEGNRKRYNKFHKGKAVQVNLRGYRIPFYDRPPASDSCM